MQVNAAKELRKLDDTNRTRIKKALSELAIDPWKAGKPLNPSEYWSIRAGDYRAVYKIYQDQNQVIVISIGHRKNVYDDFSKII
ncbi:MAG: type II toxin-antitoxin system RelE/ParE family toxin [Candidatus Bathyarchaeota archaeon]|nr:type II toxin-antitoxin system RelE/ParE family toxin [Candidatus Bathyarchaeota archaeon]